MKTSACEIMRVICSVLVPLPLRKRGVFLANIMRIDYLLAASLSGVSEELAGKEIEALKRRVEALYKQGCSVCGKKVERVVEYWDYVVARDRGIAIFDKFVPLCSKCLKAVLFDPLNEKEVKKAIKMLAKINKLKKSEVEEIVYNMIRQWQLASQLQEWKIYVDKLESLGIGKKVSEPLLNSAARGEIAFTEKMLVIYNHSRVIHEHLLYEDIDALCTGRYDASTIGLKAMRSGIEPEWSSLGDHIERLLASKKLCRGEDESTRLLEGAWMVLVDRRARARIIRDALILARRGELWSTRIETPPEAVEPAPVYFYVPSFVDISLQRRVVEEVERLVAGNTRGVVEARFYPRSLEGGLTRYHVFRYIIHTKL